MSASSGGARSPHAGPRVLALSGGVGGAKLSLGLQSVLGDESLTVVVNTGDDFWHLGLRVCPDLDTTLYTLAGVAEPSQGWGRAQETFSVLAELEHRGFDSWFRLGDRDLALHLERTRRWREGESLTSITAALACAYSVTSRIRPMSDTPISTRVSTDQGVLDFQDYFVRRRCAPRVERLDFVGAASAQLSPELVRELQESPPDLIVICPSNPRLSVDPILAVPGMRAQLRALSVPIVAVSPLVDGRAVKGPTDKLMRELGLTVNHAAIAAHYADFIDGLIVDREDSMISSAVRVAPTLMRDAADREALAREVLAFGAQLREDVSLRCKGGL
ncbi:MAG: 2-phospho-L-lactate transferase [Steroidobacteraceae bacterium]